jgi:cell division protein FtsB
MHVATRTTIRWDRVGRAALLAVLGVVLLLYAQPLHHWVVQKRTASEQTAELRALEAEHARLARRARELTRPDAIEREARRLGMVKRGERADRPPVRVGGPQRGPGPGGPQRGPGPGGPQRGPGPGGPQRGPDSPFA